MCTVYAIPFQIRQLLHNLISNALKFSNPEIPPHIRINCKVATGADFNLNNPEPRKKYCRLRVADNGIGFDQEYSKKIFEIFKRLHGKDELPGTGIGLAIVKKIADIHRGRITATGEKGKGATFDVYFPFD